MVSNAGGNGFLSVELSRVDDKHGMLSIVGSQAGVPWAVGTTLLDIAPGTVPVELRPRIPQAVWGFIFRPAGPIFISCRIFILDTGAIQLAHSDTAGNLIDINANDTILPISIVYPLN